MTKFLYIGEHYDTTGLLDLSVHKKIGITNNINAREYQLNRTKSPIGWIPTHMFEMPDGTDANDVEKLLHTSFDTFRSRGEWFRDEDDSLVSSVYKIIDYLNRMLPNPIRTVDLNTAITDTATLKEVNETRQKYQDEYQQIFDYLKESGLNVDHGGDTRRLTIDASMYDSAFVTNKPYLHINGGTIMLCIYSKIDTPERTHLVNKLLGVCDELGVSYDGVRDTRNYYCVDIRSRRQHGFELKEIKSELDTAVMVLKGLQC